MALPRVDKRLGGRQNCDPLFIIMSSFIIEVVTCNFTKLVYNRSIQQ